MFYNITTWSRRVGQNVACIIKLKFKTVIKPTFVSTFHSHGDKV